MLHDEMIDIVARRFQVLGEPCRLRILRVLQGGAMTVNGIVKELDGNQPNISKHLQILFDAGLVRRERSGNSIFYAIADPSLFRLCDLVCRSTAARAAQLQRYAVLSRAARAKGQSRRSARRGQLKGAA